MQVLGLLSSSPLSTIVIESAVEKDYYRMLSKVCDEMRKGGLLTIDDEFSRLEFELRVEEFEEKKEIHDEIIFKSISNKKQHKRRSRKLQQKGLAGKCS